MQMQGMEYLPDMSAMGGGGGNAGSIGSGNSIKTDDRTNSSASNSLGNVWGAYSVNYGEQGLPSWVLVAGLVLAAVVVIKNKRKG